MWAHKKLTLQSISSWCWGVDGLIYLLYQLLLSLLFLWKLYLVHRHVSSHKQPRDPLCIRTSLFPHCSLPPQLSTVPFISWSTLHNNLPLVPISSQSQCPPLPYSTVSPILLHPVSFLRRLLLPGPISTWLIPPVAPVLNCCVVHFPVTGLWLQSYWLVFMQTDGPFPSSHRNPCMYGLIVASRSVGLHWRPPSMQPPWPRLWTVINESSLSDNKSNWMGYLCRHKIYASSFWCDCFIEFSE